MNMKHYLEKYNKFKEYLFSNGEKAGYEKLKDLYPGIDSIEYVVTTDYTRKIIISMEPLILMRTEYNIDEKLSDNDAIDKILEIINKENEIDEQTRIADALEDLVVLNMPDEEV